MKRVFSVRKSPSTILGALAIVAATAMGACGDAEQSTNELVTPGAGDPAANGNGNGNGDGSGNGGPWGDSSTAPMSQVACLRKAALDLTNGGPAKADIDAVKAGTKSVGDVVDGYLATPEFKEIVLNWFLGKFEPTILVPEDVDEKEPARIAQYLVTNDIDFRDLVTADYTIGTDGAKKSAGAGAAGVLTTRAYLSAYSGIEFRNWAGALLRGMTGINLAPVSVVPEGTDASRNGLASNPACAGCHVNPVYGVDFAAAFHDCYDAKGVATATCSQADRAFLGQTGKNLPDLGKILASSVEWRATMIQTFYTQLGGRKIAKNELDQYRAYEKAWTDAGYKPKALLKQIVTSPEYCSH